MRLAVETRLPLIIPAHRHMPPDILRNSLRPTPPDHSTKINTGAEMQSVVMRYQSHLCKQATAISSFRDNLEQYQPKKY